MLKPQNGHLWPDKGCGCLSQKNRAIDRFSPLLGVFEGFGTPSSLLAGIGRGEPPPKAVGRGRSPLTGGSSSPPKAGQGGRSPLRTRALALRWQCFRYKRWCAVGAFFSPLWGARFRGERSEGRSPWGMPGGEREARAERRLRRVGAGGGEAPKRRRVPSQTAKIAALVLKKALKRH